MNRFGTEKNPTKQVPVESPNRWNINSVNFKNLRVADLRAACKKMGIKSSGGKAELVERLMDYNQGFLPVIALPNDILEFASSSSSVEASGNSDHQARFIAPNMDIATINTVPPICVPLSATYIVSACNDSVGGNVIHTNSTSGETVVTVTKNINQMGGSDGGIAPCHQQLQLHSLLKNQSSGNTPGHSSLPVSSTPLIASLPMSPPNYDSVMKSSGIACGHQCHAGLASPLVSKLVFL